MKNSTSNREQASEPAGAEPGQPAASEAAPQASAPPAQSPRQVEQRYVDALNALIDDALDRRAVHVLADVLAWKLAVIGYDHGPGATGDIVQKLGLHLAKLAEIGNAQREAEQAAKEGRSVH